MKHTLEGQLVDIPAQKIIPSRLIIENGVITERIKIDEAPNQYILPPFIDAHIHVESSMLPPGEFARMATVHGTGATVSDPHEIANVLGMAGVEYMLEEAKHSPFNFYFGAPSCVPATTFETAGATLGVEEVRQLLQRSDINYLAEMMNWPGVIFEDEEVLAKIKAAHDLGKPVDGHAPGLKGEQAAQYAKAGISTDHECFSYEEALGKLKLGMKVLIREGSAARNYEALAPLISDHYQNLMFCSDDKHPDSLLINHINGVVSRAVKDGYDVFKVLQMACINPKQHYSIKMGECNVGDIGDLIIVDNLTDFTVKACYLAGELVAENGNSLLPYRKANTPNAFGIGKISPEALQIKAPQNTKCRVIEALDGELITKELEADLPIIDGSLQPKLEDDILKIVVINRYHTAPPAVAFIKGFGLKDGAIASSVAHDCHNIVAVGTSDKAITEAINLVISEKGGLSAWSQEKNHIIGLPIAGLMSNLEGHVVAQQYTDLDLFAKELGSTLKSPYMTLSFMALLVIPQLKLSDKGLFDGKTFTFVDLVK